ncbi:insulinase family protein [Teredinibacter haidensis]|uniref:insulinase family protein n=1 Tax=Teredinibacter haidensis TaxID=2731755 RepID=UPI0009490152|nr:insulinase family protein [Teredinibacter haidensis]
MIKKRSFTLVFMVIVTALSGCTAPIPSVDNSDPAIVQKSPKDTREYATLTLDNQMEVLLVQDTSSEIAAVSLALGVGSFQNPEHQQGLAHYLEHMLFLGTEKYPEPNTLQKFIDHNSGRWNAYTAPDHTNYFFSLPAERLDEAMDMFSDYFKAPRFDLEFSDKERNAVNSEWSMGRSQDGRIINYLNGITGNPKHPASQLAVGNLETLIDKPGSVLNEELVAFFDRYYSANIMKLVVVSNKSLEDQEALARKHFAAVSNKNIEPPTVKVTGVRKTEMGKKIHYASVMDLKMLMLRFPMGNNQKLWKYKPNDYVVSLLASEEPGTVAQQLREQNLVKALYAQVDPAAYDYDGSFDIYADLTDLGMEKRDEIIASIFSYVDLIREQGVDEKYFLEQKAIKEKKFANMEMQQPLQTAISLSSTLLKFEPEWVIANPFVYQSFDKQAVKEVLGYLKPERARIWYISQNETAEKPIPYHEGKYRIEDITVEDKAHWQTLASGMSFVLPTENDLFSKEMAEVVPSAIERPKLIRESNGLEVWLTHSKGFQDQKGKIEILLNTDVAESSVEDQLFAKLYAKVLQSQQLSLIDRAQQAGIGLSFHFNGNELVTSLSEFNAKHELLAKRVFAAFGDWQVSEEEFAKSRDSLRQDLENREKSPPFRQMFGILQNELMKNGWSREEEKAAVDTLTRSDLVAFQKKLMGKNQLRVFAYGNYTEKKLMNIVSSIESDLPKDRVTMERFHRSVKMPQVGTKLRYKEALSGHTDNAIVHLFVSPTVSYLGKAQMVTLNALTKNSFFTQLRTNEQLGYVVGTAPKMVEDYPGLMFFVQSNGASLPEVKSRMDRFREEFLAELEATDSEVIEQIKKSQLDQLNKQSLDIYEEMQPWLGDFYEGKFAYDSKQQLIAAFDQVNKQNLVDLYKSMILGGGSMDVIVQLKGTNFLETPFAAE